MKTRDTVVEKFIDHARAVSKEYRCNVAIYSSDTSSGIFKMPLKKAFTSLPTNMRIHYVVSHKGNGKNVKMFLDMYVNDKTSTKVKRDWWLNLPCRCGV